MIKIFLYSNLLNQDKIKLIVPTENYIFVNENMNAIKESNYEISFSFKILNHVDKNSKIFPCFSSVMPHDFNYQFFIRAKTDSSKFSDWLSICPIGIINNNIIGDKFSNSSNLFIKKDIDFFELVKSAELIEIKILIRSNSIDALFTYPFLYTILIDSKIEKSNTFSDFVKDTMILEVPQKSQMLEPINIRKRICAPTNVSMVLDYFGNNTSIKSVASLSFNAFHDMYGIWPANIFAASRWNILGFIFRFESFDSVKYLIDKNIPVIASINYKSGELTNAAIQKTPGHLITIKGIKGKTILVNDPASPDLNGVNREYLLSEFGNIWLNKMGIGLILFPIL